LAQAGQAVLRVTKTINKSRAQLVSTATVGRALASGRTPLQWLPVEEGRMLSAVNAQLRVAFSQKHIRSQTGTWAFADSKIFNLNQDGAGALRMRWQNPNKRASRACCGNPVVMHVYAVVAKGHKSNLFFTAPTPPPGTKQKKSNVNFNCTYFAAVAEKLQQAQVSRGRATPWYPLVLDHQAAHVPGVAGDHPPHWLESPQGVPPSELGHQYH
jgi:hypothetical protein